MSIDNNEWLLSSSAVIIATTTAGDWRGSGGSGSFLIGRLSRGQSEVSLWWQE